MSRYFGLLVYVFVYISGCAGFIEKRAAESTVAITKQSRVVIQRQADVELARAAAPGGLVQLEAFSLAYPKQRGFIELLAEGYCQYAVGFVADDWEQALMAEDRARAFRIQTRALSLLDRCVDYGATLLGKRWQAARERGPEALVAMTSTARKRDVPGMSWIALGLTSAVSLNPLNRKRLAWLPVAQALLERIVVLDEGHNDATAHVLLGTIHSARSKLLGGDPATGKRHFDRARALTGGASLLVDVMLARSYAVTVGDRELFRQALERVINAKTASWPERRLANEMAVRKARRYLDAEEQFFGP